MDLFRSSPSFFIGGDSPNTTTRLPTFLERTTLNQLTTLQWSLRQALIEYGDAGLPAIGVSWRKLQECGLQRGLRAVQQSGLQVSSLGWVGGFTGANQYGGPEVIRECRNAIRMAAQLNASTLTVVAGPDGGHISSNARRCVSDALKELGDCASVYGVTLAFQPMHPVFKQNWSFINSLDETLSLLDIVDRASVKMALGTYHLWQEENFLGRLPSLIPQIASVQLSDWHQFPRDENDRAVPGQGQIPINDIVHTLESNGYAGWYEVEVWSRRLWGQSPEQSLQECIAATETIAQSLPQLSTVSE